MISYFPVVTGSLSVSGSVNISGGITASGGITISGSIASASFASTASFVALAQSASNAVSAATASFANTLTVAGNLTAQTLVVQTITSSVDFVTGSTRFGSIIGNTHVFTGSMAVSGGLVVSSTTPELTVSATGVTLGNVIGDTHSITGSIGVSGSATFVSSITANGGFMSLGDDGTYGSTYKTLGLTGTTNGSHRIFAGTADDIYIAAATARGIYFWTDGSSATRMRILANGNVGIGTSSPAQTLEVNGNILASSTGKIGFRYSSGDGNYYSYIRSATAGNVGPIVIGGGFESGGGGNEAIRLVTNANPGERTVLSINNGGTVTIPGDTSLQGNNYINTAKMIQWEGGSYWAFRVISSAATFQLYQGSTGNTPIAVTNTNQTQFKHSTNDLDVMTLQNQSSSPYGINITYTAVSPNNGSNNFLYFADSTTLRFAARSNGGLSNYSGNNVNLASDRRLKKDISPLSSEWNKLKQIEVVNFKYKDSSEETTLYGAIAQQVQEVYPELVIVTREATETEPEYYGLREQPFQWLTTKVLQEAMAKIETLQAEFEEYKATHP